MTDTHQQFNQAVKLHQQGQLHEAINIYQQLLEANPKFIQLYKNLFTAYLTLNDKASKIETLKQWIANDTKNIEPRLILAQEFASQGKNEDAKIYFQQALEVDSNLKQKAHIDYGNFLIQIGEIENGNAILKTALEINPNNAEAFFSIGKAKRFKSADDPLILSVEKILMEQQVNVYDETLFNFALGKAYDDLADYDKAFSYYKKGNDLQKLSKKFNIKSVSQLTDQLIQTMTPQIIKSFSGKTHNSPLPVFVIGMPRSGTTMVEQILAAHPKVFGAGELKKIADISDSLGLMVKDGLSYPLCVKDMTTEVAIDAANLYLNTIENYANESIERVIDKMPSNYLHAGLIACMFNNAKIINIKRNPIDTCLSNYFQCFTIGNEYACDLRTLAETYNEYERITDHWRKTLKKNYLEITYEDLIENFETSCKTLISFIELEWDAQCLNYKESQSRAATASSWQVRQSVYKSSINRWKNYERQLGPLIENLNKKQ